MNKREGWLTNSAEPLSKECFVIQRRRLYFTNLGSLPRDRLGFERPSKASRSSSEERSDWCNSEHDWQCCSLPCVKGGREENLEMATCSRSRSVDFPNTPLPRRCKGTRRLRSRHFFGSRAQDLHLEFLRLFSYR